MAFLLRTLVLLLGIQGINSLWTVSKITVQSGGSVTIPCHYYRQHKDLVKIWCKGKRWMTCVKMRPTNQQNRTGISFYDSPDELVTTMTMTNLRSSDSNRYWCAVKTGGSHVRTSLELSITEGTPDLSVANNRVSGEEDSNVTIRCLYSDKLRDTEKKWCISGDLNSCQTAQDIEASPGADLQINDTDDGVYTVTLIGVKKTNAGWYWCMAGEWQVPVHITVNSRQMFTDGNTSSSTFTTAPSFISTYSTAVHNHSPVATLEPTKAKLPESTSVHTFTASPKQFQSTIPSSSSYPTSTKNSKEDSSQSSSTIRTKKPLASRSTTPFVDKSSAVTVSFKETISVPSGYGSRNLIWVVLLVCVALALFTGIAWILWSWQKKANGGEEATELTAELHVDERVDLLSNELTNTS